MSAERILVLDDDAGIVNVAARVLQRVGFVCVGTTSVSHALSLVRCEEFDVVLTDIHMPEMLGTDAASAMRDEHPDLVVVIMTGQATLDLAVQALQIGAQAFVVKPFTPGDLVSRVSEAIERQRIQRNNLKAHLMAPVFEQTVSALAAAIENRDPTTGSHTTRLHRLADALGRAAGLDDLTREVVRQGALLHDVGKIGVPDGVLRKPGPLSADEMRLMRQHPEMGARMIAKIGGLEGAVPLVLHHHERWDGTGYPHRLAGDAIPIGARILAITDSYDVMISPRPYRPPMSVAEARAEVRRVAGSQFDPKLVDIFLELPETRDTAAMAVATECPAPATREHAGTVGASSR